MPNNHITEYLNYYVKKENPEFAIMLDGKWGSGKTFFIKKLITDNWAKATVEQGNYIELQPIYISVNGISSIEQINTKIREIIYPILNSKGAKFFKNLGKGFLKGALKIDTKYFSNIEIDLDVLSLFKNDNTKIKGNRILIIDDLERSTLSIEEILGYINDLVENNKCKVIILAHEEKLNILENDNYKTIKEKTVGQTFLIMSSYDEALNNFINKVDVPASYSFLTEQKQLITKIYQYSETNNLRLLKRAIFSFEYIYKSINLDDINNENKKKIILKYLLIYIMTYFYEINIGNTDIEYFNIGVWFPFNKNNNSNKKNIEDKYTDIFNTDYVPDNHEKIKKLIFNYIQTSSYEDIVSIINYELHSTKEEIPLLNKLKDWRILSDSDFKKSLTQLKDSFFNPQCTLAFNEIPNYAYYLFFFNNHHLFSDVNFGKITDQYLKLLRDQDFTKIVEDEYYFESLYLDEFNKIITPSEDFNILKKKILDLFKEKENEVTDKYFSLCVNLLKQSDLIGFFKAFKQRTPPNNQPINESCFFYKITAQTFFDIIIKFTNHNLNYINKIISSNYINIQTNLDYKNEQKEIKNLILLLQNHEKKQSLSDNFVLKSNLNTLIDTLNNKIKRS